MTPPIHNIGTGGKLCDRLLQSHHHPLNFIDLTLAPIIHTLAIDPPSGFCSRSAEKDTHLDGSHLSLNLRSLLTIRSFTSISGRTPPLSQPLLVPILHALICIKLLSLHEALHDLALHALTTQL